MKIFPLERLTTVFLNTTFAEGSLLAKKCKGFIEGEGTV